MRGREERAGLETACRQAQERSAELEAAFARQQDEMAARERREAMLLAELDAARICAQDDPEPTLAKAELERVRASLAEAETALQATRRELTPATGQTAALSKSHDQFRMDRSRLAGELAIAEERATDLGRRLEELIDTHPPPHDCAPSVPDRGELCAVGSGKWSRPMFLRLPVTKHFVPREAAAKAHASA